jgi:hypothetical protein
LGQAYDDIRILDNGVMQRDSDYADGAHRRIRRGLRAAFAQDIASIAVVAGVTVAGVGAHGEPSGVVNFIDPPYLSHLGLAGAIPKIKYVLSYDARGTVRISIMPSCQLIFGQVGNFA